MFNLMNLNIILCIVGLYCEYRSQHWKQSAKLVANNLRRLFRDTRPEDCLPAAMQTPDKRGIFRIA